MKSGLLIASFFLLVAGMASRALSQTYEALLRENQALRARLASFDPNDGHAGEHPHGPADAASGQEHGHPPDGHPPHAGGQRRGCRCRECATEFDFFCPFDDHHGGHGHCDLCGCGDRHGHGHGAGVGDVGGHDHHHEHGPGYHHSIEGYPLLHAARAEFIFIERHFHFVLAETRGADGGAVDELEFEAEVVYALNDRISLIAAAPVVSVDRRDGPGSTGLGDLEFGFRFLAFNGRRDGLFFGLNLSAPTGDADRDLGAGHTVLEPTASWVRDFGGGTYMFQIVAWDVPVSADEVENAFRYDVALLHTFVETAGARWFRYLTPSFEVNTETIVNGPAAGTMFVDFTPGVTWVAGDEDEIALGWSFPVSGDRGFDNQFLINYIRHF